MQLKVKVVSFPDGTQKWFTEDDVSEVITQWKESLTEQRLRQLNQCAFTVGEVIMPEKDFHRLPEAQRYRETKIIAA